MSIRQQLPCIQYQYQVLCNL